MSPLLLIVPFLIAVFAAPDQPPVGLSPPVVAVVAAAPASTVPGAGASQESALPDIQPAVAAAAVAPPPAPSAGGEAFAAAEAHLAAGRLPMAAYFFEQALKLGHAPASTLHALAYVHYAMDNLVLGDHFGGLAPDSPGRWGDAARKERSAAEARLRAIAAMVGGSAASPVAEASPLPPPPPARPASAMTRPASAVAACSLLVSAGAGLDGLAASRRLSTGGNAVDCLASDSAPPPATTVVLFRPGHEAAARRAARVLGGAELQRVDGLANEVEILLGTTSLPRSPSDR